MHLVSHLRSGTRQKMSIPQALQQSVAIIVNSSELRAAGFKLKEVLPPQLETTARGGIRTRGAGLLQLQGMGLKQYVLSVDDDTMFRSRCE